LEKESERFEVTVPTCKPTQRTRILIWLAKRFGPQFILPTITGNEQGDSQAYENQPTDEAQ